MSFNFGSNTTQQSAPFGGSSKPAFSFGSTNTATTSTAGFGGFGTSTSSSGFGPFGSTAASTATPFGTQLGSTTAGTGTSLFGGTGFGTSAAKPAAGFGTGFGTTTFGTGTSTAFGTGAGTTFGTNTGTAFGTGTGTAFGTGTGPAFGTGTGTAFGTGTSTFGSTAPAFGTGTGTAFGTGAGTAFGTGTSTFGSTAPAFGTLGSNTFGTPAASGSTFGSAFGTKPATGGFPGFGQGLGTTSGFGQQAQQQPQQQGPSSAHEALIAAVFNCCVFGDERDQVLAKWNLLQAQWGTGQAYYSRNAPALELNEQNPLCRFKAVGYSKLAGKEDKDGHVAMLFNKSEQEIKNNQQSFINMLSNILGNKPNLAVNIESLKLVSENKSQVVIYVVDKNAGGAHISATELATFLGSGNARNTLTSSGCCTVTPATKPTPQMLDQYLQTPPPGMDMRLWKQAQADNPDPDNYIPVPIIGFTEIKYRARCQADQAALQASWLRRAGETLDELRTRRAAAAASLAQLGARQHALRHVLLQVISRQEVLGRVGAALSPEEEAARARLHELTSQISAPPLFNGRLNELLCAVRLQRSASAGAPQERYHLDPGAQEDVKQFLTLQQRGMAHLMDTAKKDLTALNTIAEGMSRLVQA